MNQKITNIDTLLLSVDIFVDGLVSSGNSNFFHKCNVKYFTISTAVAVVMLRLMTFEIKKKKKTKNINQLMSSFQNDLTINICNKIMDQSSLALN